MLRNQIAVLCLVLSACAMGDLEGDDVGSDTEELCYTCGTNGIPKKAANYWWGTFTKNALSGYGIWNGDHSLKSLCGSGYPKDCWMRGEWTNWLNDYGNGDGTHTKMTNMTYLVKLAGCKGEQVRALGNIYYGEFCLLGEGAIWATWGAREKQYITGGLIALLNLNSGVEVCLATKEHNDCCATGYCVEETITYGNLFGNNVAVAAGGRKNGTYFAPTQNQRICGVDAPTACGVALQTWNSAEQHCGFNSGDPAWRVPMSCDSGAWQYPVTVHLPSASYPQVDFSRPALEQRLYY